MKFLLLPLVLLGLLFGCGDDGEADFPEIENPLDSVEFRQDALSKAIEISSLSKDGEWDMVTYLDSTVEVEDDETAPYTGWIKKTYPDGGVAFLFECKDGKQDGLHTAWFETGVKMVERTWKGGIREGPFIVYREDGQVDNRGYHKGNARDGRFEEFYSSGEKKSVFQYKDGKIHEALRWKPDGTPCPHTNLKGGAGIIVYYKEEANASIDYNETYLNGEIDYGPASAPEVVQESASPVPTSSGGANESSAPEGNGSSGAVSLPEVNSTQP